MSAAGSRVRRITAASAASSGVKIASSGVKIFANSRSSTPLSVAGKPLGMASSRWASLRYTSSDIAFSFAFLLSGDSHPFD